MPSSTHSDQSSQYSVVRPASRRSRSWIEALPSRASMLWVMLALTSRELGWAMTRS